MRTTQPWKRTAAPVLAVAALLANVCPAAAERYYSVVDVGTIGGPLSRARAINERGEVVGDSATPDFQYHAFLYSSGTIMDLGALGGTTSVAYGINALGQVVGGASLTPIWGHAFLYDGTMHDLGTFGGESAWATAINAAGQITGVLFTETSDFESVLVSDGEVIDLGYLQGPTTVTHSFVTYAWAINEVGEVAGHSLTNGAYHAFLWRDGTMTDLGTLGRGDCVSNCRLPETYVYGMNNHGDVVGDAIRGDDAHAFLYRDGRMHDIHTLPDDMGSLAAGINDQGQIVGTFFFRLGGEHAYLYEGGAMHDLNEMIWPPSGWTLNRAVGINNLGQIAGTGMIHGSTWALAFRLDPHEATCGDGVTEFREECDDGNAVNADACEADCTLPRCGNAILDPGETCDDGNLVDGDGCDHNCTPTACGNGVPTPGEACDDGAAGSADCCTPSCTLIDRDGDGRCDGRDPCTGGAPVRDARVVLEADAKYEPFLLSGLVLLPTTPRVDPPANGLRVVLTDSAGGAFLDATASGGEGWTVLRPGREWRYFRPAAESGAISEARLRWVPRRGRLRFVVRGAQPTQVTPASRFPLQATIVVDTPVAMTGQCGEVRVGRRSCSPARRARGRCRA